MGCGNSADSDVKRKDSHGGAQSNTARSSETAQQGAGQNVAASDDRRASVVPLPGRGRQPAAPGGTYDPSGSATYDKNSMYGGSSRPSVSGEYPTLPQNNSSNPPGAGGSTSSTYDMGEHRASYHRLLAAAYVPENTSESGSPTYPLRVSSPSCGIDGMPRSSLTSSLGGSVHMMPSNNLAMPYSPEGSDSRQRVSTSGSMFSNSTTSMPANNQINMGGERLSILSHTNSIGTTLSSTTRSTADLQQMRGTSTAVSSGAVSPSRGGGMAPLPGSTGDGYISPNPLHIGQGGGSGQRSPNVQAGGQLVIGASSFPALPPLATPISATKYPNTMYSYYPPVLGQSHHGLVTTNGRNALSTKTQTYTGKGYITDYEVEMKRRAEWEEPLVAEMLEGRELERFKYRRKGPIPALALPVDEIMCQREAYKMKHLNWSLQDAEAQGPGRSLMKNNSRHQTTQEFLRIQTEDKMRSPGAGTAGNHLLAAGAGSSPATPTGFSSPTGHLSSRHRKEMMHARLMEQQRLQKQQSPMQRQDEGDQWEPGNNNNNDDGGSGEYGMNTHQNNNARQVDVQVVQAPPHTGYSSAIVVQNPTPDQQQQQSDAGEKRSSSHSTASSRPPIGVSPAQGQEDVVLVVAPSPGNSTQAPASSVPDRRSSGSTVNSSHPSGSYSGPASVQSRTLLMRKNSSPLQQQQQIPSNASGSPDARNQPPTVPPLQSSAGGGLNILRNRNTTGGGGDGSPQGSSRGRSSGRGDRVGLPELPTSARGAGSDAMTNPMAAGHHTNAEGSVASVPLSARSSHSLQQQLAEAVQVVSARGKAPAPPGAHNNDAGTSSSKKPDQRHVEDMPGAIVD